MKSLTKKLVSLILLAMLIISNAYSTSRRLKKSKLALKSKFRIKNRGLANSVMGFLTGFVFELSNELILRTTYTCLVHNVAVGIHNKIIEWDLEDVLKIKENFDISMNEYSNVQARMRLLKRGETKLISSINAGESTSFFDKVVQSLKQIPDYAQTLQDRITVLSNTKFVRDAIEFIGNENFWLIKDFTYCILMEGGNPETTDKGYIQRILEKIFGDIKNIIIIIGKVIEVPKLYEAFMDNWNRAETEFERYRVLGKAVAGAVRIMLKAAGLSIFSKK